MAILESSKQTFSLISTIRTTYPGGVLSRSSTLTSKIIALSVNLPAGATINSVKFKCNISRVNPYYGADIHRINNVGVTVIGPYEQILSNVASHNVKIEFKSTTNTGIYIPDDNYTQWIKYTDCHIVVDYTPGASTGALDKNSVPMDGASAITLAISPKNTAYSHKVKWKTGGAEITQNIAAGTTSAILTAPLAWNSQHPNAASGAASCELETYNGATLIGSVSYPFTVTVPSTIVPTASLAAEVVDGFNGLYLQRVSKARLTTTAVGAYGSSIEQINVSGGGYSGAGSPYTTGVLQASGTVTFTVQVVDSRDRVATDTVSVTVVAYSKPSISDIEIFRCLSDGAPSKNGTYGKAVMTYAAAAVTGNSITAATVKFREIGTETYSAKTNVPSGSGGAIFGNGTLGVTKSFDVVLEVTDTVGQTSTYYGTITYKLAVFDFRKDKAGIGRVADQAKTLVLPDDWDVTVGGQNVVEKLKECPYAIGDYLYTSNATSPATRWPGTTWSQVAAGTSLIAAGTGYALNSTGGEATHTLTVNEIPAHGHIITNPGSLGVYQTSGTEGYGVTPGYSGQKGNSRFYAQNTGGGQAHNNMPPYKAVNIWLRVV